MFLLWFLYIYHHRLVKCLIHFSKKIFNLVEIALYFSNRFSSSLWNDINLLLPSFTWNILTYPLILDIIKTNGLIVLSKRLIKYLELAFAGTNFEITILSIFTSKIFIGLFGALNFCYFCISEFNHYYTMNKNF